MSEKVVMLMLFAMIFFHIMDDFVLQRDLSLYKQKQWWKEKYPEQLYENEINKMQSLKLNKYVDPKYKVVTTDFHAQNAQKIKTLLENNDYDIVLNGCDPDEEGKLIFEYTVLTTGLNNYKQQDLEYKDITDLADLKEVFLSLNENKNEIDVEMV